MNNDPIQYVTKRLVSFRHGIHGVQGVASSNLVAPTNTYGGSVPGFLCVRFTSDLPAGVRYNDRSLGSLITFGCWKPRDASPFWRRQCGSKTKIRRQDRRRTELRPNCFLLSRNPPSAGLSRQRLRRRSKDGISFDPSCLSLWELTPNTAILQSPKKSASGPMLAVDPRSSPLRAAAFRRRGAGCYCRIPGPSIGSSRLTPHFGQRSGMSSVSGFAAV